MKNNYKISSIGLALISVFSMLAIHTHATNYYVSKTSGSNAYDGTSPSTAWASFSKVNATTFLPGDVISFEGGQTFVGSLTINNSGDSTAMIKLTSYGTGQAKINAGTGTAISCVNQGYIWIDNLYLYGGWDSKTQSGSNGSGIYFNNDLSKGVKLGTVKITNCEIFGFYGTGHYGGGIVIASWTGDGSSSGYKDIQITNNSVHDNGMGGIGIVGQYVSAGDTSYSFPKIYVAHNMVYNNLGVTNYTSSHSGNGIVIGQVAGGVIEHNTTYNNGWLMGSTGGGPCGCWIWDSKNVTMQYNESYNNGTPKGKNDGDGLDFDGGVKNCIMQYNYVHDNYSVGILVCEFGNSRCSNSDNIIRYNVLENNNGPQSSLSEIAVSSFGGSVTNTLVYNNTFYNKKGSGVWDDATSSKYYNNIFFSIAKYYPIISTGNSTSLFYNNCYFNTNGTTYKYNNKTYTSLENFRSTNNEVLNSINGGYEVNPLFVNGGNGGIIGTNFPNTLESYWLQNTSTIINKGYDLKNSGITSVGNTDFNLIAIPKNGYYPIGACVTTGPPNSINKTPVNNFHISPNPAKDFLTICSESSENKYIRMIDMNSKVVLQSVMTNQITLNVSHLNEGMYIINVQDGIVATSDKVLIKK